MITLTTSTVIHTIDSEGRSVPVRVRDCLGETIPFYDTYGAVQKVKIDSETRSEKGVLLTSPETGESLVVGETHTVLHRDIDSARYWRKPVIGLNPGFIRAIQRRTSVENLRDISDRLDVDDRGNLVVVVDKATELLTYLSQISRSGLRVSRKNVELNIIIDPRRPACFGTKLLNGSFEENLEQTLSGLVSGGILQPYRFYDDNLVDTVRKTGVIFEGNNIFQEIHVLPPTITDKSVEVVHLTIETDPLSSLECTWFST